MLSKNRIKQLVEKNRDFLEALEEFDRTGLLRKPTAKERVTFTIDMEVMRLFRSFCAQRGMKMSTVIERLLRTELQKN